jgi:UDP-N-acetylglucosamine--dolichyl-phosphate N-acetylglucosaminephosphotransferase
MGKTTPKQTLFAVSLVGLLGPAVSFLHIKDKQTSYSIIISALISIVGFFATKHSIPLIKKRTLRAGLCGRDINKKGSKEGEKDVPESLGLAPGVIFLVCLILFEQLHYYDVTTFVHSLSQGRFDFQLQGASDAWLVDYNAALATICFMLFLGFADDVLDIPWRVKLLLPCLASLPLLAAYSGGTGIQVPKPLVSFLHLPGYLELGILYKIYMIALVIFCANSINILAGINGLEAGQTFIIACAVLLHNFLQLGGASGTIPEGTNFFCCMHVAYTFIDSIYTLQSVMVTCSQHI